MTLMNAKELYETGQLAAAVAAAGDEVKHHPADAGKRMLLCELLCFAGEIDRADRQLDVLVQQEPKAILEVAALRQVLRGEQARRQFYAEGRLPEFLEPPSERLKRHLEASVRLRDGQPGEAAQLLQQAEAERPPVAGTCGGQPFADLRDMDDLCASFFEVLTTTGKYYWIPMERVEQMEFHPPKRPRDLLWRSVHMVVRGGPDGVVFLPALYAGSHTEGDDRFRLGRMTDWRGGVESPVRGVGQRMLVVGEECLSIMELKEITIAAPTGV
jgi:type VI secretion system protein ImpE